MRAAKTAGLKQSHETVTAESRKNTESQTTSNIEQCTGHTLPFCNMINASFENAENVVKPPQKPVVKSRHNADEAEEYLENTPKNTPMNRHPAMFVINVAVGKPDFPECMTSDNTYLNIPPTQLPRPTTNMDFSINR